ncbi:MFS transporter [Tsukamurella ocularis]|uniref:MFS transporter n=1 Tax=Tsukamurella ocularis TaxID=1970234 RepID=UPI00216A3E20|nr:MFS transporter [Tsukamurella ocularis]MCS3781575.1 DHA2 family multidrug resistance protein-like MFS transporter [Tsukamurella ocularis]MCS3787947.1 DHA2 family multidrug resistance protein-like MFS transporter [Tsukamurella ocularis]MCS3851242.1 DHA2 family multidrug resistance protein-like MFS transporter [Tsukamurella ocularis]
MTDIDTRPALSATRRWAAALLLSASLLVITVDMTILNIAVPDLAADLRPTAAQQLWIIDVYSLVLAGLLVSTSSLGDRFGRKRMLLLGYVVFGVASALVLWAETPAQVIALRAALGVGGAMIMPTTLTMLRVIFTDPAERAKALGLWAAVSGVGAAVGPIVGGVLLENFSWRAAFMVNVPIMVIVLVIGVFLLPESKVATRGAWDWLGALMSITGMVALVWAIKRFAKDHTLLSGPGLLALLLAVVVLALFVRRSLRRENPLLDVRLFERRQFSAGILAALGVMFAMAAALLLLAQWMQLVAGYGPIETGVRLLPVAVAAVVASLAAPWLATVLGARVVLAGGLVAAALGMVLIAAPAQLDYAGLLAPLVLVGVGMGAMTVASAMIMSGTPEEKAGNAAALEETSYDLGNVLGVAILGSVAAMLYTADADFGSIPGVDAATAGAAGESLGAAMAIAQQAGLPALAEHATTGFTASLQTTGLVGGLILFVVALGVYALTPKGTDITQQAH